MKFGIHFDNPHKLKKKEILNVIGHHLRDLLGFEKNELLMLESKMKKIHSTEL